eukprot:Gb_10339 [translate_table: standard]
MGTGVAFSEGGCTGSHTSRVGCMNLVTGGMSLDIHKSVMHAASVAFPFQGAGNSQHHQVTMLRPKQFIPLCKGSRSLLVAASRNHSLDGGWVSCSEDDAHASGPRINSSTEEAANKCPILASSTAEKGFFKKDIKEATGSIIPAGVIEVDPQPRRFSFKDGMLKASLAADKYLKSYSGSSVPPVSSGGLVPRQCQESTKNGPVHNVGVIEVYQPTSFVDTFVRAGLATIDFLSGLADLNEAKYQNSNLLFMVNPDRPVSSIGVARGKSKSANFSSRTYTASPVEKTEGFELNALTRSNNSVLTQRPASDSYRAHLSSSKSTKRATHVAKTTRVDSANDLTQYQESLGSNPARNMNARGYISRIPVQGKPFENYSSSQTHLAHSTRKNEQLLCNLTPQVPPCGNATPLYGGRQASSKFSSRKFTTSTIAGNKPGRFQVDGNNLGTAGNLGRGINKVQGGGKKQIHAGAGQCNCLPVSGGSVEQVASILRQMNWGLAAEMALAKLNIKLDAYQVNQILKLQQEPGLALNFFYWSKRQPGFKHDGHSYTTMIGILGRARKFEAVKKLLDEMRRDGCEPNIVTYNRLIHCYGRANYTRDSVEIFYQMQEAGCKPDRVTYCTLIDIHAKAGFLDVAMDMYGKMQNAGLLPDTFTYSVIINCLGKAGDLYSAYKLFCEMIERGCVPNLVTYNIIIDLHAKARKYSTALKLYREMQNAGFYPDKVTYSIVMEVLGHCGHLEEAEAIFSEMQQADWIPDEPVYGLLVDLWGKAGNVQKASEWYSKMLNSGLRPNVPTCNSLLSAFLKVRMFNDAQKVLQTMLHLNLYPSFQTYTLLLSCCTDSQCQQDMDLCSSLMASTGHPTHSFLLSLPAAEPGGQNVREHVANFFDMMHSEDQESKRGLVDAVINFLHRADFKEEAGYVWEVAMQKNLYPHAVTQKAPMYWLINLHVMSMGTALIALSRTLAWFREHMLMSGVGPGRIDIITGWGRRSRVMGSSLVKQSVEHLLHIFGSPFYVENGNSGCFVGFGDPLIHWLHESYVERMHLL